MTMMMTRKYGVQFHGREIRCETLRQKTSRRDKGLLKGVGWTKMRKIWSMHADQHLA